MYPRFFITLLGILFIIIFATLIGIYVKQKKTDKTEYKVFIGLLVLGIVCTCVGSGLYARYAGESAAFRYAPQTRAIAPIAERFGFSGGNLMNLKRRYF